MLEDKKPETGITDEELMRLTMALDDDDFNFEENFTHTEVNPSKVQTNCVIYGIRLLYVILFVFHI
jgi:hypothetical protein